jgi:catechol 2,3-dioxygenase-like lactoylglutathione lyase family enzyme
MITALWAGMPVTDLDESREWYARFFGREPDLRVGDEILWDIGADACLFIEPGAEHAGAGRMTLGAQDLDAILERLAAAGIAHEPVETYANGVRQVLVPDPDGNRLALAEAPT